MIVKQVEIRRSRGLSVDRFRDGSDVVRRAAAAAADQVDQARVRKLGNVRGHGSRRLVVPAKRIGETGVGIADDVGRCAPANVLHERPHFLGPESAVQTDAERSGMADTDDEGFSGLAG